MPSRLNPYLSFRDNAREAMEFYQGVFGGELTTTTFKEFDVPRDPADDDKIMHGMLEAPNGMVLMGADTPSSMDYKPGSAISVSLSGDDEAELRGYYDRLKQGGVETMPMAKAPWGDFFGMVRDRFGVDWLVNIAGQPEQS
ncbi:MAG TPA: VOC family protein [Thermoleophilia bacterium]|nr:VOC family protein [Thermoleophilia bacterium]